MQFAINDCTIDTDAYEVRRHAELVHVEPQVFDLLVLLIENRDRIVTKDEIIERIWQGRIVSDGALSSRMMAARQAIGDDGVSQGCIQTIRRRGYRVVADVTERPSRAEYARRVPLAPAGSAKRPEREKGLPSGAAVALGMPRGPGIAVLKFTNLSDDSRSDFFCDAITEEIAAGLTRFSELRVAARSITSDYDPRGIDPIELGPKIGVEYLVEGSLQRSADQVRVIARLLRTMDGRILWAETYERRLTPADIFQVQDDISSKVVAAIASISTGVIAQEAIEQTRGKPPRSLSAYECTVRANEIMMSGFSAASHLATRGRLEAAVESEPDYSSAWAMLAWTYTIEHTEGHNRRRGTDPRERAVAAARRAVELAPANPIARFAMARAAYLMRDMDVFHEESARALSLNPHEPFLLGCLGNWLAFSGRWKEGVTLATKAIALNPRDYPRWWHAALGKNHYRNREYRMALVEFKKINLPNWWWNQVELAYTHGQLGDTENARKAVTALLEIYPGFNIETAVFEHRKFNFEQSYIDHAVDGLSKAGVPHTEPVA